MNSNINFSLFALLICVGVLFSSCEDVIDVDLDEGTPQLNVDAFLNNLNTEKRIRLQMTAPYFDNSAKNYVEDATVSIADDMGGQWNFTYDKDGFYVMEDTAGFIRNGYTYTLFIKRSAGDFVATSTCMATIPVDSIRYEDLSEDGGGFGDEEGYFAEFYATDIVGEENFYWIKHYRNGAYSNAAGDINISADGGAGEDTDGFTFIPPIRFAINDFEEAYELGEKIRLEIHSINEATYEFLSQVQVQMTNGGLFADPPYNVTTNVENISGSKEPADLAVGWFSVSMVKDFESIVEDPE